MLSALAQSGATEKTVFVWAAGNAHGDPCDPNDFVNNSDLCVEFIENNISMHRVDAKSVQVLPGLPARIDELRGHVIAVVGIAANGEIAGFSNRCGIAADWCLAAPGAGIRLAYFGPDPDDSSPGARGAYTGNGTSFAAPMVAGSMDPSRKSGGALHRLHCFCLEFDGACEVQRRVPTDWVIEPIYVSGYGSFSLAS